jgi:hypothetical protein
VPIVALFLSFSGCALDDTLLFECNLADFFEELFAPLSCFDFADLFFVWLFSSPCEVAEFKVETGDKREEAEGLLNMLVLK